MKNHRKILFNFFFSVIVFMFMLALAECAVRLFVASPRPKLHPGPKQWAIIPERSWVEYHPVLGWWQKKNTTSLLKKNGQEIPVTLNSLGLRGAREYVNPKPPGAIRICAMGDSFTFGFGVRDHETFPAILEQRHPQLEVLNFGVPGYGIDQIDLAFRELAASQAPDVVLISIFPEDFWRAKRAFNDGGYGKPYFVLQKNGCLALKHVPVPTQKKFNVSQFPSIREYGFLDSLLMKSRFFQLSSHAWGRILKQLGVEDPDTSEDWVLGRSIVEHMIREIRIHHARPILLIVPPLRWITGTDEPVRQSLLRFAKREDVDIIDLTPLFQKASRESDIYRYYIKDDEHWTADGHRLVADTIFKYMQEHPGQLENVKNVARQKIKDFSSK